MEDLRIPGEEGLNRRTGFGEPRLAFFLFALLNVGYELRKDVEEDGRAKDHEL